MHQLLGATIWLSIVVSVYLAFAPALYYGKMWHCWWFPDGPVCKEETVVEKVRPPRRLSNSVEWRNW
jgi:hypothetical protein